MSCSRTARILVTKSDSFTRLDVYQINNSSGYLFMWKHEDYFIILCKHQPETKVYEEEIMFSQKILLGVFHSPS
jgi:hypothetical protein